MPIVYLHIGAPTKIYGCKTQLKMQTTMSIERNEGKMEELKEKEKRRKREQRRRKRNKQID